MSQISFIKSPLVLSLAQHAALSAVQEGRPSKEKKEEW